MKDTIRGKVTKVIDGDTFVINVMSAGKRNGYGYNATERIRIAEIDAPELNSRSGRRSRTALERRLRRKEVRCYVDARDRYGRLIARVKPL